jgi:response regulator RpfG family c-di-GMP phosphodiesterase
MIAPDSRRGSAEKTKGPGLRESEDMNDKQGTVLVIDDSPASIHQVFALLGDDYEVLAATSGAAGIELAAAQHPDLILLDVIMPGLGGHEVCERLKRNEATADIPVVFVSATADESDETHGLALGAADYLTKPLHRAIVRARVKNHVDLKRCRELLQRLGEPDPSSPIRR